MKWKSGTALLVTVLLGFAVPAAGARGVGSIGPFGIGDAEPVLPSGAEYPDELHGTWLPPDISCGTLDAAGSDALVVIQRDRLPGYEHVHLIQSADRIAETPGVWLIESALSLGGDTPDDSSNIFVLAGSELVIACDGSAAVYRKCR